MLLRMLFHHITPWIYRQDERLWIEENRPTQWFGSILVRTLVDSRSPHLPGIDPGHVAHIHLSSASEVTAAWQYTVIYKFDLFKTLIIIV